MNQTISTLPSSDLSEKLLRSVRHLPPLLLLARVTVKDDRIALEAWQKWRSTAILDDVSWSEVRMLAIIAPRISALDPEYPELGRLRGFRRFVFAHTHRTLHATRRMMHVLRDDGIELMVFKGAARVAEDPASAADRYMADVDVAVRLDDWERACAIAEREGWTISKRPDPMRDGGFASWYPFGHGLDFRDGADAASCFGRLDLHHHMLHICRNPDDDLAFWKRARQARFLDLDVLTPDPTDQLLITLTQGMRRARNSYGTADWTLDAAVLARSPKIKWERLVKDAERLRIKAPVAAALLIIKGTLRVRIPPGVLEQLSSNVGRVFQEELEFVANSSYRALKATKAKAARDALVMRAKNYVKRSGEATAAPLPATRYPRIQLPGNLITDPIIVDLPQQLSSADKPVLRISFRVRRTKPDWAVSLDSPMVTLAIIPLPHGALMPNGGIVITTDVPIPSELFIAMRARKLHLKLHRGAQIEKLSLKWHKPAPWWRRALSRARRSLQAVRRSA